MLIVCRIDIHSETTPSGVTVSVPQVVRAVPRATQSLVRMQGEAVLRRGDRFSCQHRPQVGTWTTPLPDGTGAGELAHPGQLIVRIQGIPVVTLAGTNIACTEGVREMQNRATASLTKRSLATIKGAAVLTGKS